MNKTILSLLISIFAFSSISYADFVVEPRISMLKASDDSSPKNDVSAMPYGIRLGYSFVGFYAALDYEMGSADVDGVSGTYDFSVMGLTAGYRFPIMLDIWLTSIMSSEFSKSGASLTDGSGTKFGLGYTIAPFVKLFIESTSLKYGKVAGVSSETKVTGYQIGLSFPIF